MQAGFDYAVVGGGVAGVTCALQLATVAPSSSVVLVSASREVTVPENVRHLSEYVKDFEICAKDMEFLHSLHPNITCIHGHVKAVHDKERRLEVEDLEAAGAHSIGYREACICSGARPEIPFPISSRILCLRDAHTIQDFAAKLEHCKRLCVVGNGGVALEAIHATKNKCDVVWAVKEQYIGNTFFDINATHFLLQDFDVVTHVDELSCQRDHSAVKSSYGSAERTDANRMYGGALGPTWKSMFKAAGTAASTETKRADECEASTSRVCLKYDCTITNTWLRSSGESSTDDASEARWQHFDGKGTLIDMEPPSKSSQKGWPIVIRLSDSTEFGCDFLLAGTGVRPVLPQITPQVELDDDGGVLVDHNMRIKGLHHTFAAGDCAAVLWPESPLWFQMRLWTQAHSQGLYAAMCMANAVDELTSGVTFELFAHATTLMGKPCVFLGAFNGQNLEEAQQLYIKQQTLQTYQQLLGINEHSAEGVVQACKCSATSQAAAAADVVVHLRYTPKEEYVKVITHRGRLIGAMLIGSTELSETFENLILNAIDLEACGVLNELLNPEIDLEDYFD